MNAGTGVARLTLGFQLGEFGEGARYPTVLVHGIVPFEFGVFLARIGVYGTRQNLAGQVKRMLTDSRNNPPVSSAMTSAPIVPSVASSESRSQ